MAVKTTLRTISTLTCLTFFGFSVSLRSANAQSQPAQQPSSQTSPASEAHAQGDIAGNWQGTLPQGNNETRTVLKITKAEKGWSGKMFFFAIHGTQPFNVSAITLNGSNFKYSVDVIGGSFEGELSADGTTIAGTLTGANPNPAPLTFVRATKETAWEIPPPSPTPMMEADADPSFEVATIKPNNSVAMGMQQMRMNPYGRNFATRNSSLNDLITFAYAVQMKQIVGAPAWMDRDRYDIAALTDRDGAPSPDQLRIMIRKLLADRFKLTFHHDSRELSAYVLTVTKNGQKLTPSELKGPPGLGRRLGAEGLTMLAQNETMADFAGFLQMLVLDRPVVDKTGISGRFDFHLTFTPDDSEFGGHPPPLPTPTETTNVSPGLFEAIQQQLGLKLNSEKTPVDVIVIDHVEKPSAN